MKANLRISRTETEDSISQVPFYIVCGPLKLCFDTFSHLALSKNINPTRNDNEVYGQRLSHVYQLVFISDDVALTFSFSHLNRNLFDPNCQILSMRSKINVFGYHLILKNRSFCFLVPAIKCSVRPVHKMKNLSFLMKVSLLNTMKTSFSR